MKCSEFLAQCNSWLGRRMFLVVLTALAAGLFFPLPSSPSLAKVAVALFAYMTFITALETSFKDFLCVIARPWVTLWVLLLVHGAAPLLSWTLGLFFYPDNYLVRLGLLLGALTPIGVTSIIWTSLVRGDVALALAGVTVDTLVSPFLLPLLLALIAGQAVEVDYRRMLAGLLWMVTLPSVLGMAANELSRHRLAGFSRTAGGFTSKLALFGVVYINAGVVAPEIHWGLPVAKMLLAVLAAVAGSFALGYLGSLALKDRRHGTVAAMIYNVGMRNFSFGVVLAMAYFPPAVAVPVTLGMIFQQPLAALISYFIRRPARRSPTASLS
ncbi:bile acid:sodium symporter family protein [Desulfovirgula thermocuniculi]|uniref:bile acid:sodium symporter family protein n=1 Tax=Desulfovirgula thermocuniculi TaxID=348842 RepID=UPI000683FFE3|nr:bile acid:sodium symporter [Desulfovirgula thermocuniculi]